MSRETLGTVRPDRGELTKHDSNPALLSPPGQHRPGTPVTNPWTVRNNHPTIDRVEHQTSNTVGNWPNRIDSDATRLATLRLLGAVQFGAIGQPSIALPNIDTSNSVRLPEFYPSTFTTASSTPRGQHPDSVSSTNRRTFTAPENRNSLFHQYLAPTGPVDWRPGPEESKLFAFPPPFNHERIDTPQILPQPPPSALVSATNQRRNFTSGTIVTDWRNGMASAVQMSGDARRHYASGSNRYENRVPSARQTACKNGPLCRKFQEGTCPFNHDFSSLAGNGLNVPKKSFNVESPSFTPKLPAPVQSPKIAGLSPRAAHAATFTPRGSGSVTPASSSHSKTLSNEFVPQNFLQSTQFAEFVPQNFVANAQPSLNHQVDGPAHLNPYPDPFLSHLDGTSGSIANPYAEQQPASNGQAYFQESSTFRHPLNYHLYASLGPHREQLAPYQRQTTDFFIPDDLREDLQRKSEASLQTFQSSNVPQNVDNHFHSLVMLDSVAQRTSTTFGYPSWIYKATSSTDGNTYALRRIEGFRLTNEHAIGLKLQWKKVTCSSAVRVLDAFTTQAFGDRSLIVVLDYYPLSQTLADKHFPRNAASGRAIQFVPEHELWGYLVQLGNALRAIHNCDLAARSVVPSKVLLTSKNRLRLSGCCVLDILHFEQHRPISELQQADLQDLGRLVLDIAARNPTAHSNPAKALDQISRNYTDRFRACLAWLLAPPHAGQGPVSSDSSPDSSQYNVNMFLGNISDHVMNVFDSTLSRDDELTSTLAKETENGRLVRLLAKLNAILERPETNNTGSQTQTQPSNAWSETGDRYYLTLFRDYVFHQVDHDGRPVLNLGHIVTCLNKLDAGIDEKMQLVSRNEQSLFIVSYKELKRGFEAAWGELSRGSHGGRR